MNGISRAVLLPSIIAILVFSVGVGASTELPGNPGKAITLEKIQIPFIENRGQVDERVAFYAQTFGGVIFITTDGEMVLTTPSTTQGESHLGVVREKVVGGLEVSPKGMDISPTKVSHIIGNEPAKWQRDVSTYTGVSLGEVYEGIEMRLEAKASSVEKIFTVKPGADPSLIRMKTSDIKGLSVEKDGQLRIQTPGGTVTYSAPVAYQKTTDRINYVNVAFTVQGDSYGFEVGPYDQERPLIIDPILGATYLGGTLNDDGYSLAVAGNGHVYVTGRTLSTDFPGIDGSSAQTALSGTGTDVFLAHFDPSLGILYRATYLGGTLSDEPGYGSGGGPTIAVHPINGKIYVTGLTQSANFPAMSAGFDSTINDGSGDAFVARLDPDLTSIEVATYYGGGSMDLGTALVIDPLNGDVYITGRTQSSGLPGTAGNYDSTLNGTWDAFVALFSPDLDVLRGATYIGGSGIDWPFGITTPTDELHPAYGSVYVTGQTSGGGFPPAAGGAQETSGGSADAFVVRLSGPLTTAQGTFLGGAGGETGFAVQVHPDSGDIYVCGTTSSADFPNVSGGAQSAHAGTGWNDAFVAILSPDLGTLGQSTYLGGSTSEDNSTLFIDPASGDIYLAGTTFSDDFPGTTGGAQPDSGGDNDVFAARLSEDLTTLYQATYVGGSSRDNGYAIGSASVSNGVYITGLTWSGNFPGMSDTYSAQPEHGGTPNVSRDAFVVRLDSTLAASYDPDISVVPLSLDFGTIAVGDTLSLPVVIANDGAGELTIDLIQLQNGTVFTADINRAAPTVDACSEYAISSTVLALQYGENCSIYMVFAPPAESAYSDTLSISSDDPDESLVDISLEGTGGNAPDIRVTPISYDFGVLAVGDSVSQIFTISNAGASLLSVENINLTNDVDFHWQVVDCPDIFSFGLSVGSSCTISVKFAPADYGARLSSLRIESNDPDAGGLTQVSLTGGTNLPDISVSPLSQDIHYTKTGSGSNLAYFTIVNLGGAGLTVYDISLSGVQSDLFTLEQTGEPSECPATAFGLGPGDLCDFWVGYNPTSDLYLGGPFPAEILISSDDPDEATTYVNLLGYGAPSPDEGCSCALSNLSGGYSGLGLLPVFLVMGLWMWRRRKLG